MSVTNVTNLPPPLSNTERTALVIWSLLVAVISVSGNLIVLVSSLKYNALRLDKVTVTLIRNICVADLSFVAFILLTVGNIVGQDYQYGNFLCFWSYCFAMSLTATEMGLICGLNASKLVTLLHPLRASSRKTRTGKMIAGIVWILPFGWTFTVRVYNYLNDEITAYFDTPIFQCLPIIHTDLAATMVQVGGVIFNLLPSLVLIVTTVWLFLFIHKTNGVHKCTILTLTLVSGVFLLAYGPYSVGVFLYPSRQHSPQFMVFFRFAAFSTYLNYAANPIIYFITVRSFREFLLTKVFYWLRTSRIRSSEAAPATSSSATCRCNETLS